LVKDETSVTLSVLQNSDANAINVARSTDASKDELNEQVPEGAELTTVIDTSDFIELSVSSVTQNLLTGGVISVSILLLFLKSLRATIVIALSIPIAIISTFSLMY